MVRISQHGHLGGAIKKIINIVVFRIFTPWIYIHCWRIIIPTYVRSWGHALVFRLKELSSFQGGSFSGVARVWQSVALATPS